MRSEDFRFGLHSQACLILSFGPLKGVASADGVKPPLKKFRVLWSENGILFKYVPRQLWEVR